VLVLRGLCQILTHSITSGEKSILDSEEAFEDGGVEAGLTEEFGTFIADRTSELLEALQAPKFPPLDNAAIEDVAALLDWAITVGLTRDFQAVAYVHVGSEVFIRAGAH
jgi:hypothetical protein